MLNMLERPPLTLTSPQPLKGITQVGGERIRGSTGSVYITISNP